MTETASAPVAEATPTASAPAEGAPVTASSPAEAPSTKANGHTVSEADLAAIDAAADAPAAEPGEQTIKIGGVEVPISALADLPDDALRHIKRKIKANGEETEVSLAEALDELPLARGAKKKMWEAAQLRKQLDAAAQLLGEDPVEAISRMRGISRDEAADIVAAKLMGDIERMSMSPEDRKAYDERQDLERRAKLADEYKAAEEARTMQARVETLTASYARSTRSALEQAGLQPTPYNVQRVASVLQPLIESERLPEDVPAEAFAWAAQQVQKERAEERTATFGQLDGDALLDTLGEDIARKVARAYAQKVRKAQPAQRAPEGTRSAGVRAAEQQKAVRDMTMAEWRVYQNKRMSGG